MSPSAPASEAELLTRARAIGGRTIAEVASELSVHVPASQQRAKGFVGTLVERALGAPGGSRPRPDFEQLGIELKTLPVDRAGHPRESTFVCSIDLARIEQVEWERSRVRAKLARVLFVPVEAERTIALGDRRIGAAVLWSPDGAEERALREDWEELAGLIGTGRVEDVTAHLGRVLQVRPKAAHSRVRRRAPAGEEAWVATVPRGFYLRATFTTRLLARALGAQAAL